MASAFLRVPEESRPSESCATRHRRLPNRPVLLAVPIPMTPSGDSASPSTTRTPSTAGRRFSVQPRCCCSGGRHGCGAAPPPSPSLLRGWPRGFGSAREPADRARSAERSTGSPGSASSSHQVRDSSRCAPRWRCFDPASSRRSRRGPDRSTSTRHPAASGAAAHRPASQPHAGPLGQPLHPPRRTRSPGLVRA